VRPEIFKKAAERLYLNKFPYLGACVALKNVGATKKERKIFEYFFQESERLYWLTPSEMVWGDGHTKEGRLRRSLCLLTMAEIARELK